MRVIQITPLAKARVWLSGNATSGAEFTGAISGSFVAESGAVPRCPAVTVEALVPRGPRAEYGLLGLAYVLATAETTRIEVGYSTKEGVRWDKSLAMTIDDVRLGLPEEYSQAVLQGLSSALVGKLGPGVLRVAEAAHGAMGSSPSFFAKLSLAAAELMFVDASDEQLAALLKGILVG